MNIDTIDGYAKSIDRCLEKSFKVHLEFSEGTPEKLKKLCLMDEGVYAELYDALIPSYEKLYNEKKKISWQDAPFDTFQPIISRTLKSLLLKEIINFKMDYIELNTIVIKMNAKDSIRKFLFKEFVKSEQTKVFKRLIKASDEEFKTYLSQTVLKLNIWLDNLNEENKTHDSLVLTNIAMITRTLIKILTLFEDESLFNFVQKDN